MKKLLFVSVLLFFFHDFACSQNKSSVILEQTYFLFEKGKTVDGLKKAKEGLLEAKIQQDSSMIVTFCYMQSKFYRLLNHVDSAINQLVFAEKFIRNKEDRIKINYQIGEILLEIGSYKSSIPYLKEMVDNENNLLSKFYHFNLLGQAYLKVKDKSNCVKIFKEQLKVAEKIKDIHFVYNAKNNLGFVYLELNDFNLAEKYLVDVKKHYENKQTLANKDSIIYLSTLQNYAKLQYFKHDFQKCIELYELFHDLDLKLTKRFVFEYKSYFFYIKALDKRNENEKLTKLFSQLRKMEMNVLDRYQLSEVMLNFYYKTNQIALLKNEINIREELYNEVTLWYAQKNQKDLDILGKLYLSDASKNVLIEESKMKKEIAEQKTINQKRKSLIYLLVFLSFSLVIVFIGYTYFNREKQKRNRIQQLLTKVEKENLDITLQLKQRDLSKASIDLSQRSKALDEFLSKFKRIEHKNAEDVKAALIEEIKELKQFNTSRNTLNQFLEHSNEINTEFHVKLKQKHPDLTQNEIDLCSFILLNIPTKDIANLKGISPNSVRMNKMRLKKKMLIKDLELEAYLHTL